MNCANAKVRLSYGKDFDELLLKAAFLCKKFCWNIKESKCVIVGQKKYDLHWEQWVKKKGDVKNWNSVNQLVLIVLFFFVFLFFFCKFSIISVWSLKSRVFFVLRAVIFQLCAILSWRNCFVSHAETDIFFYWHSNCKVVFRYLTKGIIQMELCHIFAEIVK